MCSNQTIQYIKDFNVTGNSTGSNEHNICKVLRPLSLCEDLNLVDLGAIQTNMLFINLHKLLSVSQKKGVILDCIQVLSKASSNQEIKKDIVQKYKFIQVIITTFSKIGNDEIDLCRLLTLLENLTFDQPCLYLEECYLRMVIPFLVNFLDSESSVFKLSLSVLVNICHNEKLAPYLLARSTNISKLVLKIKGKTEGILSYKLYLLLEGQDCILPKDFLHFIKMSMHEIEKALVSWEFLPIKHCLDIYLGIVGNYHQNIPDFSLLVEDLLKKTLDRLKQTDDEENEIAKVHFFNEFYQILKCFLTLDGSLVEAFHAIMLNAIKDFNTSPPLKFTILQLLGIYFQTAEESTDTVISIRDKLFTDLIEKFISSIEESSYIEQTEFMKLISTLARKKMFPGDVGKTYPPLFQKIFSRLKDMECNYDVTLCKDEILLYISALCTLVEFSNQYPKLFYAQMEETFKLNMIPVVLSKAQMLGDHATCYAILKLAKLPEFPTRKVAKVYCEQNFNQPKSRQTSNFIEFLENNKGNVQSSQLEQKLDSLISVINGKLEKNEINSVLSSNIVDIYRHKVNLLNDRIDSLTNQIQKSAEVNLTSAHEVQSYKIIIDRQEMMNFQLQISNETMSVENHNLLVATQALTKSASEFQNKIEKSEGKIITFQQKINGKEIEIKNIRAKFEAAEIRYQSEKKSLKGLNEELLAKVEGFKKEVKQFDSSVRDKDNKLKEYALESSNMTSKIVTMEKEISMLNATIKRTELDLETKTEQLEQREQDLKASEDMYSNIMAIMQGKTKSGRK